MAQKLSRVKRKAPGIRINPKEGLWIKYRLAVLGISLTEFAKSNGVKPSTVSKALGGTRKSARLETSLYQTLGYPSFEAMIAASRGHNTGGAEC